MIVEILNYFQIVRGIHLLDRNGEVHPSWERRNPWGANAYVYPILRMGCVTLNEDKTCSGEASYIKKWEYME